MKQETEAMAETDFQTAVVPDIVQEHVEEAIGLHAVRTVLTGAARAKLTDFVRFDGRLAAHIDALAVAGEYAWTACETALAAASPGAVFALAVRAVEERREDKIEVLIALAKAIPDLGSGLIAACGWLEGDQLRGFVPPLLGSGDAFKRFIAVAACAVHRVDPGLVSSGLIVEGIPWVRSRALRTVGEIGLKEALSECLLVVKTGDADAAFWAARSSVLLGSRGVELDVLASVAIEPVPYRARAFELVLQASSVSSGHSLLKKLADDPKQLRWLIKGTGIAGDPVYMPWLIRHMTGEKTARLSGEAFTLITGVDLAEARLERSQPADFESGPNDSPDDSNVDMDPDDGLPWPDVEKIEKWWTANSSRFQKGTRYFMGASVTREHCLEVLKNGYQRQRILAAHYLCLLEPGTPLFNTSAPAWRQQRLLAKMT